MRQLFLNKGMFAVKNVAQPLMHDDEILVSVHYSCICPDVAYKTIAHAQKNPFLDNLSEKVTKVLASITYNGVRDTKNIIKEKMNTRLQAIGFSCSGKVLAVGKNITTIRPGDFVACMGAEHAHHADIISIPKHFVTPIDQSSLKEASLSGIATLALQTIRRANPQIGETINIVGLGLIGQLIAQIAKHAGCNVIGIDTQKTRLNMAKEHGADSALHFDDGDIINNINYQTNYQGADYTIITQELNDKEHIKTAINATRAKGKIIVMGNKDICLNNEALCQKEIDVLPSYTFGPGQYEHNYESNGLDYPYQHVRWTQKRNLEAVTKLIKNQVIKTEHLFTKTVVFNEAQKAFNLLEHEQTLGILLDYEQLDQKTTAIKEKKTAKEKTFIPAKKDVVRVGVIGAGNFAKKTLIPIVARIKNTKINAIVDEHITNALTTSKTYKAATALTDDTELFKQDLVDAVIISSPHASHTNQTLTALKQGKAVFVEKPIATNKQEFEKLKTFLTDNENVPFCAGYNRSFSPIIQSIKQLTKDRVSPLMIQYRINTGCTTQDNCMQSHMGAGSIISQACHIFDLFYYLTGAQAVSVSVEAIKPTNDELFPTDNFSAQVSFSDGSVCSLFYTSLGHPNLVKERMEIFVDSKALVMEDYKSLKVHGFPKSCDQRSRTADKGHEALLRQFFAGIQKETYESPIPLKRLLDATELTFIVDQLVCQGGGEQNV